MKYSIVGVLLLAACGSAPATLSAHVDAQWLDRGALVAFTSDASGALVDQVDIAAGGDYELEVAAGGSFSLAQPSSTWLYTVFEPDAGDAFVFEAGVTGPSTLTSVDVTVPTFPGAASYWVTDSNLTGRVVTDQRVLLGAPSCGGRFPLVATAVGDNGAILALSAVDDATTAAVTLPAFAAPTVTHLSVDPGGLLVDAILPSISAGCNQRRVHTGVAAPTDLPYPVGVGDSQNVDITLVQPDYSGGLIHLAAFASAPATLSYAASSRHTPIPEDFAYDDGTHTLTWRPDIADTAFDGWMFTAAATGTDTGTWQGIAPPGRDEVVMPALPAGLAISPGATASAFAMAVDSSAWADYAAWRVDGNLYGPRPGETLDLGHGGTYTRPTPPPL